MRTLLSLAAFGFFFSQAHAQINILSTNPLAEQIMLGQYDPSLYQASTVIDHPDSVSRGINERVSPDSLKAYLMEMSQFQNRNTASDTVSSTKGIGAARRWAFDKFQQFSAQNEHRLIVSYLQFDYLTCDMGQHRNIFAVLPGRDTADQSVVLMEAHFDTRCTGLCDTSCLAQGMEDNGSGSALILELARVMSRYTFNHSIVFLLTIGEEQGLLGAKAFADYAVQKGIKIKSVFNNDVVGGIICGQTSSPPSCPGLNDIDSLHVRLFSYQTVNSKHKQLVRYIKLQYKEMLQQIVSVPMDIMIMTPEDRTGRSGDHVPFRQHGFTAMRFTAANEHGDCNVSDPNYNDRQHTSNDILGVDTDNDQVLDSFFVDFNYLARNAVINGNAAGMIALSPQTPQDFSFAYNTTPDHIAVNIVDSNAHPAYRIALRTTSNDWDSVYTVSTASSVISVAPGNYTVSVAAVDDNGVESLFSQEKMIKTSVGAVENSKGIELLPNKPNPADEATALTVMVHENKTYRHAYISIKDLIGKEIKRMNIILKPGANELIYEHGYGMSGTFIYSLVVDGILIDSGRMVFVK